MAKLSVPFVRSANNYDVMAVSDETGLRCEDESLAQQNFLDECDINTIVQTFTRSGELPSAPLPPQFGDFSGVRDFHSALNQVLAAQEAFLELDPAIRTRFGNDPQNLISFLEDPANRPEAEKLGLVVPQADLSTPPQAASTAKRSGGVDKSIPKEKASVEPSEGSGEGD